MALIVICLLVLLLGFFLVLRKIWLPIRLASFYDCPGRPGRHLQLMDWTRRYGRTYFTLNKGFRRNFVSSEPSLLAKAFGFGQSKHLSERRTFVSPKILHLFVASGDDWRKLRRECAPLFSTKNINSMELLFLDTVNDMVESMAAHGGAPFDFCKSSTRLYAALLSRLAFRTAFPECELTEFPGKWVTRAEQLLEENHRAKAEALQSNWGNIFRAKRQKPRMDIFRALYQEMRAERDLAVEKCQPDLIWKGQEKGEEHVEMRLGRILLDGGMKVAGLETIRFALACAVHFLSSRPALQSRLSNFEKSPLLQDTIHETLRLCPIVSFANTRVCTSSTLPRLSNGIELAKGDTFEADIFSLGRDPELWGPDAGTFRPERWTEASIDKTAWLPFGMGPRKCIGFPLAMDLLEIALGAICGRFHLVAVEREQDEPVLVGNGDVLWPKDVRIRTESREEYEKKMEELYGKFAMFAD